jgi:hypothetical protein
MLPRPMSPRPPVDTDQLEGVAAATGAPEPAATPPSAPSTQRAFPVRGLVVTLEALSAAVISLAYAAVLYHVWDVIWKVPIYEDRADARAVSSDIKTMSEYGWWDSNPALNFPFGQFHTDFPAGGESLQLLATKLLMWVTPGYGHAINLYFLGGFGVLAAVTFLVLRHLRFAYPIALVASLAYTFLPYHFHHEQSHLHRSTYFTAPLACLLLIWALSWRTSFLRNPDPPPGTRWRTNLRPGRVTAAIAIAIVIGITETMATAFSMSLLGAAAIVTAVRWREPQRLLVNGAMIAVLFVAFLAVSSPTIAYVIGNGRNPVAGQRATAESEHYSLKISRMVLAQGDVRLQPWAEFGARAQEGSPVPSEGGQYLGILGIAGFLGGLIAFLGRGLRRRGRRDLRQPEDREALVDHASLLIVLSLLLGMVASFNVVLATVGFNEIRTWNRIVVIVALLALMITAVWFERLGGWLRGRLRNPVPAYVALTLAVGAFALWDGIPPAHRDYPAMAYSWFSDQDFVDRIDARMPDGSAIYQVPVVPFPEAGPTERMLDYDHYRGYLHDTEGTLRWSYGGVKGRPIADWQLTVRDELGPIGALPALLGMGYDGLWVDTFGFADGGAEFRADLEQEIRTQPQVSRDKRLLFYDLRPYRRRLGLSDAALAAIARNRLGIGPPTQPPS